MITTRFKQIFHKLNSPLYHDSLWAIIGSISLRGLGLLGSIVVARFLGSEIFGEYGAIKNTIVSIAIFSTYGLGYTATKYVADLSSSNPGAIYSFIKIAVKITIFFGLFLSLATLLFSDWIANIMLNVPHLADLIKYVSVWIIFNALTTLQIGILSGLGEYKAMAVINTFVGVFTFASSVILTWFYKLEGSIFALIISQIFNWFLYYRHVKKFKRVDSTPDSRIMYKSILIFSFPVALQEMLYSVTSWLCTLILVKYSTYQELGLYTASAQWSSVVLFIPGVLRNVILSSLSKEKEMKNHNLLMKRMILINIGSTIVPVLFILAFSTLIVESYGDSFNKLQNILFLSLGSTLFFSINNVYSQAYMSLGKNWHMFFLRLLRDMSILGLTLYFVREHNNLFGGAISLALATLLANIVFMIVMGFVYNRIQR